MTLLSKLVPGLLCFGLLAVFISKVYASKVSVEGITVKKPPGAWGVIGKVRNLENHPIKGFVRIKFLDAKGNIVKSANAFVTSRDPLEPGQTAPFELWTDPASFTGVIDFEIIFVDR